MIVDKNSTQSIGYSGTVTITYKRNGMTIMSQKHNTGTVKLFEYLAGTLCGNNESSYMPLFIQAYDEVTGGSPIFNALVPKTSSIPMSIDGGCAAVFKFIIPYSMIGMDVNALRLELLNNRDTPEVLATVSESSGFFKGDGKTNIEIT